MCHFSRLFEAKREEEGRKKDRENGRSVLNYSTAFSRTLNCILRNVSWSFISKNKLGCLYVMSNNFLTVLGLSACLMPGHPTRNVYGKS